MMKLFYKDKEIEIPVRKISGLGEITGLMFRKRTTENLLFEFKKELNLGIHSYFVFFNFIAVWVDKKNKVIEWKIVKPFVFGIKPKKNFVKLIEIPSNKKNKKIIDFFVGKGKI